MISSDISNRDANRVTKLKSYSILDKLPEKDFDDLSRLAARVCTTPMAVISLLDEKHHWDKSVYGRKISEISVLISITDTIILHDENVIEIPDLAGDERFCHLSFVTEEPPVHFLAAVPIRTSEGYVVGTLSVMDHQPRVLEKMQIESLQILADLVFHLLELKVNTRSQETSVRKLEGRIGEMEVFTHQAAHHLKSPLCTISMMTELFREQYAGQMDQEGIELLDTINEATSQLAGEVDDLLNKRSHK
jgi:GAF domain-containing protein